MIQAAHKLQRKPDARQPSRKIRQQSAANASDRFFIQAGAADRSDCNVDRKDRNAHRDAQKKIDRKFQAERQRRSIADGKLRQPHRQKRQQVAENKIRSGHRRCIKPQHERTAAIL